MRIMLYFVTNMRKQLQEEKNSKDCFLVAQWLGLGAFTREVRSCRPHDTTRKKNSKCSPLQIRKSSENLLSTYSQPLCRGSLKQLEMNDKALLSCPFALKPLSFLPSTSSSYFPDLEFGLTL